MKKCIAAVSSVTYALKGQELLAAYSIRSAIVKLDSSATSAGCSYGIETDCGQMNNVQRIFANKSFKVSEYIEGRERNF